MTFIITYADGYYVLTVPGFKEYKLFEDNIEAVEKEVARIAKKHKVTAEIFNNF